MLLPCRHEQSVVAQIEPTKNLLRNLHVLHPEILRQHGIDPTAYADGMVFRSAIESIRGTFIASPSKPREEFVGAFLERIKEQRKIHDYTYTGGGERCDFYIQIDEDYLAGLEVKGGEGNSINISDRPAEAKEFAVWSHLDGAIVNQPSDGAHKVIGRLVNELTGYDKQVDVLFIRDKICNTPIRPCQKYAKRSAQPECSAIGELGVAPDVFLFPQRIPTPEAPNPPIHTLQTVRLPRLLLELFGVPEKCWSSHVWEVRIELVSARLKQLEFGTRPDDAARKVEPSTSLRRYITIWHEGAQVDRFDQRRRQ